MTLADRIPGGVKGLLYLGMSAVFMAGAIWSYMRQSEFMGKALESEGVIEEIEKTYKQRNQTHYYHPKVRFAVEDRQYVFKESSTVRPRKYAVGQQVTVAYDPQNPRNAQIKSRFPLMRSFLLAIIGLGLLAAGIVSLLRANKETIAPGKGTGH